MFVKTELLSRVFQAGLKMKLINEVKHHFVFDKTIISTEKKK